MGFKFSLQTVLEHRQTLEEQAQREYSESLARLEATRRRRTEVEADIARCVSNVRIRQARSVNFAERELYERWIGELEIQVGRLQDEIQKQSVEVEKLRLKLVKAVQDRTVMEKLREKELAAFRIEENRAELKQFDDIAVRDFAKARLREKIAG